MGGSNFRYWVTILSGWFLIFSILRVVILHSGNEKKMPFNRSTSKGKDLKN